MVDYSDNCPFCLKFGHNSQPEQKEWYDIELFEQDSLLVTPGLGPLLEGYLLILPKDHHLSLAEFSYDLLNSLIDLKEQVRKVISKIYGNPVFFEHGISTADDSGSGSCIDHAHLHVMPTVVDLLPVLSEHHSLERIDKLYDLRNFRNTNYIYFENQVGEMYVARTQTLPGQYLRRLYAGALSMNDEWDYALFPRDYIMSETIKKLHPWPS